MPRGPRVVFTIALLAQYGAVAAASSTAHELPLISLPGPSPPPPPPPSSLPWRWQPLNLKTIAEQTIASSAHSQLSALPPSPSPPPPSPPPTGSSTEPSLHSGAALRIVRPFATHDWSKLSESFDRWDEIVPCASGAAAAGPLPRPELVLYYSRSIRELRHAAIWPSVQALLGDSSARPWRSCFSSASLLCANLTKAQDKYMPSKAGSDVAWNSGPNVQFYRMLRHYSAQPHGRVVYFMEPDSVPMWHRACTHRPNPFLPPSPSPFSLTLTLTLTLSPVGFYPACPQVGVLARSTAARHRISEALLCPRLCLHRLQLGLLLRQ